MLQQLAEIPCRELNGEEARRRIPIVSVLMMAYQHEAFLKRAIDSVVGQRTDFPFELIIAEDCSPDRSLDIAREYQSRYPEIIRILTADTNVGMQKNCWRMYARVRGEFIAFCDGDDFWNTSDKLQKQVDLMRRTPECILCHSNYSYRNELNGLRTIQNFNKKKVDDCEGEELLRLLVQDKYRPRTPTMLFRTAVFQEIFPLFGTIPQPAYDFSVAFLLALTGGRFCYCPESLATYCQVGSSATARDNRKKRYRFIKTVAESAISMMEILQRDDLMRLQKAYLYPVLLELALLSGNFSEAKGYHAYLKEQKYYRGMHALIAHCNSMTLLWAYCCMNKVMGHFRVMKSYDRQGKAQACHSETKEKE